MLFQSPPPMFGLFHILWLAIILVFNVLIFFIFRNESEEKLIKAIHFFGILMVIGEVWKQWFCYTHIFQREINLWFFPWQLCSMAMYLSFFLPLMKGKFQDAAIVFLSTFSLFAAIIAILIPSDMLRPQLIFASHGFIYHGIMIAESILSILIIKARIKRRKDISFLPSAYLFLGMTAVAEVINIIGYSILKDIHISPNMFYITPYYETTQLGLNYIAKALGIFPEIAIYLSGIILFSYLFFRVIRGRAR